MLRLRDDGGGATADQRAVALPPMAPPAGSVMGPPPERGYGTALTASTAPNHDPAEGNAGERPSDSSSSASSLPEVIITRGYPPTHLMVDPIGSLSALAEAPAADFRFSVIMNDSRSVEANQAMFHAVTSGRSL
jgi:hypothetical protein